MTKNGNKLISIIVGLAMLLTCFAGLFIFALPKQTASADAPALRGKLVIWDYYVAAPNDQTSPYTWAKDKNSTSSDANAAIKYIVLKNVHSEPINIAGVNVVQMNDKSANNTFSIDNQLHEINIKSGGYVIITTGGNLITETLNKSTLPSFIKSLAATAKRLSDNGTPDANNPSIAKSTDGEITLLHQGNISPAAGTKGGIVLTTKIASQLSKTTTLNDDVIDMIAGTTCWSRLGTGITVHKGTHLLRKEGSWNNAVWNNAIWDPNTNTGDYIEEANWYTDNEHNSLSYLIGNLRVFDTVAQAKAKAENDTAEIRATITYVENSGDDKLYTVQDNSGAMYVKVANGNVAKTAGTIVIANGTIDANGVLQVDNNVEHFASDGTDSSSPYTLATIEDINTNTDTFYTNHAVALEKVTYDKPNNKVYVGGDEILVDRTLVEPTTEPTDIPDGSTVNLKGIVRVVGDIKTIQVASSYEYKTYAYGQISTVRGLPKNSDIHFSVQGFVTYAYGTDAYLQDNSAGIQLFGEALSDHLHAGDYVIIDGVRGDYNNNIQVSSVKWLETIDNPEPSFPEPATLTNSTDMGTNNMHQMVKIANATITAGKSNNFPVYTISFGDTTAYLDVESGHTFDFDLQDEIVINRGVVFYKHVGGNPGEDILAIKVGKTDEYIVKKTNSVSDLYTRIENNDVNVGDSVFVKGTITYIDVANGTMFVQSNGKGIKVTNVPDVASRTENTVVKLNGTLAETSGLYSITAETIALSTNTAESAQLVDFATVTDYNNLFVSFDTAVLRVASKSDDNKTLTLNIGEDQLTLQLTYALTSVNVYDYVTVKGVAQIDGTDITILNSNSANVQTAMTTVKYLSETGKTDETKNITFIVRGVVTYIEVDGDGTTNGIENMIIEQTINGVNYALKLYNKFIVSVDDIANLPIVIGDTVTVQGKIYAHYGLTELTNVTLKGDGDIIHGEATLPTIFTFNKLNESDAAKHYQSLYIKAEGLTFGEIYIDENQDIMAPLTQDGKTVPLYLGIFDNQGEDTEQEVIAQYTAYFNNLDYFAGDTFDFVGHIGYYKKNQNGGFRLELHLDGLHTIDSLEPSDYTSNQVKTKYTITFVRNDETTETITDTRNKSFVVPTHATIPGKTFMGWTSSNGQSILQPGEVVNIPTENVTYTAKFENAKYTVHFVTGTAEIINDIPDILYGDKITLPNPSVVPDKHTFGGWFTDQDYTHAFTRNSSVTSDTTLYAKWVKTGKEQKPVDVVLVVITSVSITLVVVGIGIMFVVAFKSKKTKLPK